MRIELLAIGDRGPLWAQQAYSEYAKRLPFNINLRLIPAGRRSKNTSIGKLLEQEGQCLLGAVSPRARVVVLDEHGHQYTTLEFVRHLERWLTMAQDINLLIGGADGLAPACLKRADELWSLSQLTLPHVMVRMLVMEQLYRAWSILKGHPYHRGDSEHPR